MYCISTKRTVLLGCILLIAVSTVWSYPEAYSSSQQTMKLATWNIRIFSNTSRDDDELRAICNIAKDYDFLAIVELRDEQILQRMVTMLNDEFGRSYVYEFSPAVDIERYAFLYDPSFITCVQAGQLYPDDFFFRKPYYATFKAGNFDFTIIVIHIIWGDSVSQRRAEINRLADVYTAIQDSDPNENDVILVGDFNRDPDDDLAWGPFNAIPGIYMRFSLPDKSMIWDSHLYDNIIYQIDYVTEHAPAQEIVYFDELYYQNDDDAANLAVSDHRPCIGEFYIDAVDDD